jgi:hypothetical protein
MVINGAARALASSYFFQNVVIARVIYVYCFLLMLYPVTFVVLIP